MPQIELDGLPVIDAPESDEITVAVSADDMEAGDAKNPERHPVAIALRQTARCASPGAIASNLAFLKARSGREVTKVLLSARGRLPLWHALRSPRPAPQQGPGAVVITQQMMERGASSAA